MKIKDAPDGLLYLHKQTIKFAIKRTTYKETYLICADTGQLWVPSFDMSKIECTPIRLHNIEEVFLVEKLR